MSFIEKYSRMLEFFDPLVPESLGKRLMLLAVFTPILFVSTLYFAFQRYLLAVPLLMMTMFLSYGIGKLLVFYEIEKSEYSFSKQNRQSEESS